MEISQTCRCCESDVLDVVVLQSPSDVGSGGAAKSFSLTNVSSATKPVVKRGRWFPPYVDSTQNSKNDKWQPCFWFNASNVSKKQCLRLAGSSLFFSYPSFSRNWLLYAFAALSLQAHDFWLQMYNSLWDWHLMWTKITFWKLQWFLIHGSQQFTAVGCWTFWYAELDCPNQIIQFHCEDTPPF